MPLFPQAVFDVIHRTANPVPFRVSFPEMDRQGHLCKLGAHPQQRAAPHPEHRTGAADGNGTGHTGDIPRADRGRQGRAHSLEGRYSAFGCVLFMEHPPKGLLHGSAEAAELDKPCAEAEQQPNPHNTYHRRNTPYKAVHRGVHTCNCLHDILPLFFQIESHCITLAVICPQKYAAGNPAAWLFVYS